MSFGVQGKSSRQSNIRGSCGSDVCQVKNRVRNLHRELSCHLVLQTSRRYRNIDNGVRILRAIVSNAGFATATRTSYHIVTISQCTRESSINFSDNSPRGHAGALSLANLAPGRSTPRSKHYAIKLHWFRSKLDSEGPHAITVEKISTDIQRADILTKGLSRVRFQTVRKLLCWW
jgi:hypothetical protein